MHICLYILRLYTCQIFSAVHLFENSTGIFPKTKAEGHFDSFQLHCWWALYAFSDSSGSVLSDMAVEQVWFFLISILLCCQAQKTTQCCHLYYFEYSWLCEQLQFAFLYLKSQDKRWLGKEFLKIIEWGVTLEEVRSKNSYQK